MSTCEDVKESMESKMKRIKNDLIKVGYDKNSLDTLYTEGALIDLHTNFLQSRRPPSKHKEKKMPNPYLTMFLPRDDRVPVSSQPSSIIPNDNDNENKNSNQTVVLSHLMESEDIFDQKMKRFSDLTEWSQKIMRHFETDKQLFQQCSSTQDIQDKKNMQECLKEYQLEIQKAEEEKKEILAFFLDSEKEKIQSYTMLSQHLNSESAKMYYVTKLKRIQRYIQHMQSFYPVTN
jgi:hypothetical protein